MSFSRRESLENPLKASFIRFTDQKFSSIRFKYENINTRFNEGNGDTEPRSAKKSLEVKRWETNGFKAIPKLAEESFALVRPCSKRFRELVPNRK